MFSSHVRYYARLLVLYLRESLPAALVSPRLHSIGESESESCPSSTKPVRLWVVVVIFLATAAGKLIESAWGYMAIVALHCTYYSHEYM